MDSLQRFGATFRAVRIKRGWRQIDVAARVGVHRSVISAIERGHLERVSIGTILAIARVLEIGVSLSARWRAGDLDRLIASRHGRLHESVARWFETELPSWILAPEVSFSIFGERGIIDILAWHPGRRALLVIELKTDIVDVNDLLGTMDQRRRLARQIALDRGWDALTAPPGCSSPAVVRTGHDSPRIGACSVTPFQSMVAPSLRGFDGRIGPCTPCHSGTVRMDPRARPILHRDTGSGARSRRRPNDPGREG